MKTVVVLIIIHQMVESVRLLLKAIKLKEEIVILRVHSV